MGKALYREYRSTSFDEVIGQDHITSTLKNSLKNGSFAHAYLLTGPRGVGKTSVARILAFAVNNLPYDVDGTHLDIIEIDAASNRRIDEIRSLRERVHIAPTSASYKVYIIDEVHMLTREAFNALLKTLEEPPAHVIFILATTEIHKLPDTIVSRCITFTFRPIDEANIVKHLKFIAKKEKLNISDDAFALLAIHGEGSFRDSISLLDQIKNMSDNTIERSDIELALGLAPNEQIDAMLKAVAVGNPQELEKALQAAYLHGANENNIAKQFAQNIREQLIAGTLAVSSSDATQLLRDLLEVPASARPRSALELCLLSLLFSHSPQEAKTPAVKVELVQPQKIQSKVEKPELTESLPSPTHTKTVEPGVAALVQLDLELWGEVLLQLKKQNNTLYGIARMAQAEHSEDTLLLSFKFPFHFKQVNQPKNKSIITSIIEKLGHKDLVVTIALASDAAKAKNSIKNDKNDALTNITDIFGSGEVLES